jgi:Protein of unknown function (DUF3307)
MNIVEAALLKLIVAHLLTDFVFQPGNWISHKNQFHFRSSRLYLHGIIAGITSLLAIGFHYWWVSLIILVSHILIDGWKSYRPKTPAYFLIDQLLHISIVITFWTIAFQHGAILQKTILSVYHNPNWWKLAAAFIFITTPAGILIGQLTQQWRNKLPEAESLANAGKWIGIIERLIILILILEAQYGAIGLLIAAKGIIRFNEKDRQEIKTEYLVIGTLMSIGITLITGLLLKW